MSCIFCKIISGEIPTKLVAETPLVVAFDDIHPLAPTHVLVIPRKHIVSMNDCTTDDTVMLGDLLLTATKIAKERGIAEGGYKLLLRTGKNGGQEVPHIHLHLIGGAPLFEEIYPL